IATRNVEDPAVQRVLLRIVVKIERNPSVREELMQEGLVHIWLQVGRNPGHSRSWYLQSCKYHLQHYLGYGRSVDSPKRASARMTVGHELEDADERIEPAERDGDVVSEVSAREMIALLCHRLEGRRRDIFGWLVEGFGPAEIAKKMKISRPAVVRHRHKIA